MIDFDKVLLLLQVCDLSKNWPPLKRMHDAAMAELVKMQEEPEEETEPELPVGGTGRRF